MSDLIGIIPGAGRATRIGGFFKELTPINVNPLDISKFVVVCEEMIQNIENAGVSPLYFVINNEKQIISEYFNKLSLFPNDNIYFSLQGHVDEYYGMPFAIDKIYNESKGKTVLLGMPDTLIEPKDSFKKLLNNFKAHRADIELGLFKIESDNHGGYIEFDLSTKIVTNHIDKTNKAYPLEKADNAWAIVCWNSNFTEFMHAFIAKSKEEFRYSGFGSRKELLFGDIIDAAINSSQIKVCADFIDKENGYYLDISEPKKYFKAVLHFHSDVFKEERTKSNIQVNLLSKQKKMKIFISHSSKQKLYANDLHFMLLNLGYIPIIDTYSIHGGNNLKDKIRNLITECDYFVLLISKDTLNSQWVQTELTYADAKGMIEKERVFPVQIEELTNEESNSNPIIPKNTYNWINGREGIKSVVLAIDEIIKKENTLPNTRYSQ